MKRRSRLLRVAKWGGVVMCGFVVIASIASMWLTVVWNSGQPDPFYQQFDRNPNGGVELNLSAGLFGIRWRPPIPSLELEDSIKMEKKGSLLLRRRVGGRMNRRAGWTVRTHASNFYWWSPFDAITPFTYTTNISGKTTTRRWTHRVTLPLWLPLVLIAIPTAFFWWRDRKPKPGHCPCGYDLTGNVSGRCPECGRGTDYA